MSISHSSVVRILSKTSAQWYSEGCWCVGQATSKKNRENKLFIFAGDNGYTDAWQPWAILELDLCGNMSPAVIKEVIKKAIKELLQ